MALKSILRNSRYTPQLRWTLLPLQDIISPSPTIFMGHHREIKSEAKEVKKELRKNEEITASSVRLVEMDGTHRILSLVDALQKAKDASLDLIEVSGESTPPVVKLANYDEISKQKRVKEKEWIKKMRIHQKQEKLKELRLTPRISSHDLEMKVKKMIELLDKGHKIHVVVMAPTSVDKKMGHEALQYIQSLLQEKAKVCSESKIKRQGTVSMTLIPLHDMQEQDTKQKADS